LESDGEFIMAVKYLSGNRLWGTNAERLALTTGYTDGNGIDGTANDITVDTTEKPDFTTASYDFDYTADPKAKIEIDDSLGTTAFTFSAWVNTILATGNQSIYGQLGLGLNLYVGGSTPQIRCSQGGGGSQIIGGDTILADNWYNVIFTKTAGVGDGVANLYLDNSNVGTQTDWSNFTASSTSLISGHQTDYWNGFMTDIAVWNVVISEGIRDEINEGALISDLSTKDNIVAYFPCTADNFPDVINVASPVYPSLSNGSIFITSDTNVHYMWNGTDTWNEVA